MLFLASTMFFSSLGKITGGGRRRAGRQGYSKAPSTLSYPLLSLLHLVAQTPKGHTGMRLVPMPESSLKCHEKGRWDNSLQSQWPIPQPSGSCFADLLQEDCEGTAWKWKRRCTASHRLVASWHSKWSDNAWANPRSHETLGKEWACGGREAGSSRQGDRQLINIGNNCNSQCQNGSINGQASSL